MPSAAADLIDKINATSRRVDALTDVAYLRAKRDLAQMRADDRETENWRRSQMRRDAENCRKHQARYDAVFAAHGQTTPAPLGDEPPGDYRRRLLQNLISKLPSDHEWSGASADSLNSEAIKAAEPQILEAAKREGESPSGENRPDSVYSPGARRERIDPNTGQRVIEWHAKRSFIADEPRSVRRVLRIQNPNTGQVLIGPAYAKMPGR
jgi:hypothetical protein